VITHIVQVKKPGPTLSDGFEKGDIVLTESVSNSPSGEYRPDTITCLFNGQSSIYEGRQWNQVRT